MYRYMYKYLNINKYIYKFRESSFKEILKRRKQKEENEAKQQQHQQEY